MASLCISIGMNSSLAQGTENEDGFKTCACVYFIGVENSRECFRHVSDISSAIFRERAHDDFASILVDVVSDRLSRGGGINGGLSGEDASAIEKLTGHNWRGFDDIDIRNGLVTITDSAIGIAERCGDTNIRIDLSERVIYPKNDKFFFARKIAVCDSGLSVIGVRFDIGCIHAYEMGNVASFVENALPSGVTLLLRHRSPGEEEQEAYGYELKL